MRTLRVLCVTGLLSLTTIAGGHAAQAAPSSGAASSAIVAQVPGKAAIGLVWWWKP